MSLHDRGQRLQNRVTRDTDATGQSVIYTRGGTARTLVATPMREQDDGVAVPSPGTRSADRQREYVIVYSDLTANGFGEPAVGDRITEIINGDSVVFEVVRNRTEPAWRWADTERTRVIVHTREQKQ